MDGHSYQHGFSLPFPTSPTLVLFRAVRASWDEVQALGRELAGIIADELHLDPVAPERWATPRVAPLDARMPTLRPADVRARRQRMIRQILVSDTPRGRCPVGLIHPIGFWAMFPCQSVDAAERLIDRLSPA
jgi:hypothetical protein